MNRPLASVAASPLEVAAPLPGDHLVPLPDVVMDRGFDLPAPPAQVWPWLVQLGKRRSGWYLPRGVERLVPSGRRAARRVLPARGRGSRSATSCPTGAAATPPSWWPRSRRRATWSTARSVGRTALTWVIVLRATGEGGTRVHLRLRLAPVRRTRLAHVVGGSFDAVTVAGMAAGLRERLEDVARSTDR